MPPGTLELVKVRASEINGCGFCSRLGGRGLFTEAENAALELAEQGRLRHITRDHLKDPGPKRPHTTKTIMAR